MPYRPVFKETSNTTKVRPVFDVSASGYIGISLNDCMFKDPSLNPDLLEVMIKFRRFLLKCEDKVKNIRFLWVPFGNTASPFLSNPTIKHHLEKHPCTEVIQELEEDMYVYKRIERFWHLLACL